MSHVHPGDHHHHEHGHAHHVRPRSEKTPPAASLLRLSAGARLAGVAAAIAALWAAVFWAMA